MVLRCRPSPHAPDAGVSAAEGLLKLGGLSHRDCAWFPFVALRLLLPAESLLLRRDGRLGALADVRHA